MEKSAPQSGKAAPAAPRRRLRGKTKATGVVLYVRSPAVPGYLGPCLRCYDQPATLTRGPNRVRRGVHRVAMNGQGGLGPKLAKFPRKRIEGPTFVAFCPRNYQVRKRSSGGASKAVSTGAGKRTPPPRSDSKCLNCMMLRQPVKGDCEGTADIVRTKPPNLENEQNLAR